MWDTIASALAGLSSVLLAYMINKQGKFEDKFENGFQILTKELASKVTKEDCESMREECFKFKVGLVSTQLNSIEEKLDEYHIDFKKHFHTLAGDKGHVVIQTKS